ncbi:PREDICTED: hemolymph lipopolysaccharide-binding protein-like [Vollenhovia emeryi]|uniref:hemolymph lipopolysaccharide-binding protein-like n=1 Tax=Vollenhovia emeryi TaxID=411798 RepID=UPI0005F48CDB|nr:PREDICTED: hemolymph lipopolysaccharide-binding protein-like [Vollenhovia emeryi]
MFKYHLIVLVFWCEIRGYDVLRTETDTDIALNPPASSLYSNKQTSTEEPSTKSVTMNGHANYNVGQQIFYIYDSQFFRRLLFDKDDSLVSPGTTDTHRLHSYKLTWNKARQTCIQQGGHLAVINSHSEERMLSRMLREINADTAWLGLHDLYEEGDWVTVMDQPIENTGYTAWTNKWSNVPDNAGGNQHCAVLIKEEGMDDVQCNSMHYFFCEISA